MAWKLISIIGVLMLLSCTSSKPCDQNDRKKCSKGCAEGQVCMKIYSGQSGNYQEYCGAPQSNGCSCDPGLPNVEACVSDHSCKPTKCSNNGCKYKCSPFSGDELNLQCKNENGNKWRLAYYHDPSGNPFYGTFEDLKNVIDTGAEVKISTPLGLFNVHKLSSGTLENVKAISGQALFGMIPTDLPQFLFNIYTVASTTGAVQLTGLRNGEPEQTASNPDTTIPYSNSNYQMAVKWFVRNGSTEVSSDSLQTTVRNFASMRIKLRTNVNTTYRPLESLLLTDKGVVGTSIWEMRDWLTGREFLTQEQWQFSRWDSERTVKGTSWPVNNHTMTSQFERPLGDVTWFGDICWDQVYRHDNNGQLISGSLANLVDGLKQGKRVRIRLGKTVFYEANKVIIPDDETSVSVQIYDSLCDDLTDATWCWLIVSTSGSVTTITSPVGEATPTFADSTNEVAWLIEKRPWTLTLSVDAQGIVTESDGPDLQAAFNGGADFRYCYSRNGITECLQADYVKYIGRLRAYHDRDLEVETTDGVKKVFRKFTFAYSNGKLQTYKYVAEGKYSSLEEETSVAITWFTSGYA